MMKSRKAFVILILFLSSCLLGASLQNLNYPVGHATSYSAVFNSTASDGYLAGGLNTNYAGIQGNASADGIVLTSTTFLVGQNYAGGNYVIDRGFLLFNTASLSGYMVTAAVLSLNFSAVAVNNFTLTVKDCGATYPHDPVVVSDYAISNYSSQTTCGTLDTSTISATKIYVNITLTEYSGIGGGTTRFALLSNKDLSATAPSGGERVTVYANESTTGVAQLYVTYSTVSDNFENFSTGWTLTTANGGTINKSSTQKHAGSFSCQIYSVATTSQAYGTFPFVRTGASDQHLQIYLYVDGSNTVDNNIFIAESYDSIASSYSMYLSLLCSSGSYYLDFTNGTDTYNVTAISSGSWIQIDSYYNYTNGNTHIYVDQVKQGTNWVSALVQRPDTIYVGDTSTASSSAMDGSFYIDDLTFDSNMTEPTDTTSPTYSSQASNSTGAGASCKFSSLWTDNANVSGYIFSTNNTGVNNAWTNDSWTSSWTGWANTTAAWANVTKTLNSTAGLVIGYRYYVNDTSNNWAASTISTLTTTSTNSAPVNSGCAVTNLDGGQLLAKMRYYSWSVNVTDPDGYADLISVDLNFSTSGSAYAYGVRWNQTTSAFSVLGTSNGTYFWLGTTSSNASSGTWDNLTFTVMFGWNYPYTTLNARVYTVDSVLQTDQDDYAVGYVLVEAIQTTTPTALHLRMNAGASTEYVSGILQYAGTSTALSNSEVSNMAVHDQNHANRGAELGQASYNCSFTLNSTVGNDAYHIACYGTDASFPSGDVGSPFYVVSDSVTVIISNSLVRVNVNANATGISGSAKYDYDGSTYGGSLTWNDTTFIMPSPIEKYFTVSSISGDSYGITLIRSKNPNSTSIIWDYVNVVLVANSTSPSAGDTVAINASAIYAYDGSAVSSWSFNDLRNGTHFAVGNFTDYHATAGTYNYTTENVTEGTYGLTVFSSNTVTLTWSNVYWQWTLRPVDGYGNTLSSVTMSIFRNGVLQYSNTTVPWTLLVLENTYNVTVTWRQNLTVNSTLNIYIGANANTNFTCLCYPYTVNGATYWVASNITALSTSGSLDSVTVNYTSMTFTDQFNSLDSNVWTPAPGSTPLISPDSQLQMLSQSGPGTCALATKTGIILNPLPSEYTVEFRLRIDQFGTGATVGFQNIGIYDTNYWIPLDIYADHIKVGTQTVAATTDNNWHTWTIVCDHTGSTFDVYQDGIKLSSLLYVSSSGLTPKISLDGYGGTDNYTLTHWDWINMYNGLIPPSTYVLVASCPSIPTYITNVTYDKSVCYDPYGYLVLGSSSSSWDGRTMLTISYVNWGGLGISMTDHPLNNVEVVAYGDMSVNMSGATGDFGHIKINCDGKGNPWDTGSLTTSYAGTTLTGTYTFTDTSMSFLIRWYSPNAPNPGNPGNPGITLPNLPTNLFANVILSFPTYAQPGSVVNGTLNVTWSGYPSLYLWSVTLNSGYRNWTLNMPALPLLLQGFAHQSLSGLDGEASIPVTLTIPTGAELNGTQQIPCTVTVQTTGGSGKALRAYISLDLIGLSAQIPNIMTYGFVALVVGALVTMPLFMRSKKKRKKP